MVYPHPSTTWYIPLHRPIHTRRTTGVPVVLFKTAVNEKYTPGHWPSYCCTTLRNTPIRVCTFWDRKFLKILILSLGKFSNNYCTRTNTDSELKFSENRHVCTFWFRNVKTSVLFCNVFAHSIFRHVIYFDAKSKTKSTILFMKIELNWIFNFFFFNTTCVQNYFYYDFIRY